MRTLLVMIAMLALVSPAQGQGWIEPAPGRLDPGVVKVRTNVIVRVTDRIARVEVEEWFRNAGSARFGEGDYLYPLPGEAVFSDFSLFQGDIELRGETMDAERARAIYEEIVRRKKDPALIELVGHGLVRARVFPINAGETRKITMRYTQVLKRAGDALQFRYAAGGRFSAAAPSIRETSQGPQRISEPSPLSFRLIVEDGARFRDAFSPTHGVRITREDGRMAVRPEEALTGDFALFLPLAGSAVGLTLATHRPSSEDGYFMLTLSPSQIVEATVPRDVTVVVDVSGSMSGEKMEQARGALRQLLGTLNRSDRVRLISFSTGVRTWRDGWTPVNPTSLRDARDWIDRLTPEGGTNISGALAEAFSEGTPESRLPIVVFMTDGLPSAGETNPERIAQQAEQVRGRARVFSFGVGFDVNTYLLDALSAAGRGATEYVEPGDDVERALGSLASKIRHPVLADLEIGDAPVRFTEVYPTQLPDLFAGEDLVVFGRYEGSADRGHIAVTGQRGGGTERYTTAAAFPRHELDNDFLPRLWASRKLGELTRQIRLNGAHPELVEEVRRTALRYGLLSEYTSYLVLEPDAVVASGGDGAIDLAAAAPASMTGQAAVAAAQQSRREREVRSLRDVDSAQNAVALDAAVISGRADGMARTVAGRMFAFRNDAWTDVRHDPTNGTIDVKPFGPAYFALLRALPELEAYWSAMPSVLVAGAAVNVRVSDEGAERLSAAEIARIASAFRARESR